MSSHSRHALSSQWSHHNWKRSLTLELCVLGSFCWCSCDWVLFFRPGLRELGLLLLVLDARFSVTALDGIESIDIWQCWLCFWTGRQSDGLRSFLHSLPYPASDETSDTFFDLPVELGKECKLMLGCRFRGEAYDYEVFLILRRSCFDVVLHTEVTLNALYRTLYD